MKVVEKLFTRKTLVELYALSVHSTKGCLSSLKPHHGPNQNEVIHRYLNQYFTFPRMGVDLAYALIMVLVVAYEFQHWTIGKRSCNWPDDSDSVFSSVSLANTYSKMAQKAFKIPDSWRPSIMSCI